MKQICILITVLFAASQWCLAQTNNKGFRFERVDNTNASTQQGAVGSSARETTTTVNSGSSSSFSSKRIVLGGTVGMGFGNYTNINVSPQIGYMVTDYLTLGGGVSYNYYGEKDYDYSRNYLGANLYARAYPIQYLTLYVQPEVQRSWGKSGGVKDAEDVFACLLLGAGVVLPTGNGGVTLTFYYDVLQHHSSPYGNKIGYSVGYIFRL